MRPKYYDFEGYGFDEYWAVSRARRARDQAERKRQDRKRFVARHRENWDDDWDEDFDDYSDNFDNYDDDLNSDYSENWR